MGLETACQAQGRGKKERDVVEGIREGSEGEEKKERERGREGGRAEEKKRRAQQARFLGPPSSSRSPLPASSALGPRAAMDSSFYFSPLGVGEKRLSWLQFGAPHPTWLWPPLGPAASRSRADEDDLDEATQPA